MRGEHRTQVLHALRLLGIADAAVLLEELMRLWHSELIGQHGDAQIAKDSAQMD